MTFHDPGAQALSHLVGLRTYQQFDRVQGRRETLDESFDRTFAFFEERAPELLTSPALASEWSKAKELAREVEVLPSLRWLAGARPGGAQPGEVVNDIVGYNCMTQAFDRPGFLWQTLYVAMAGCGVGATVEKRIKRAGKWVKVLTNLPKVKPVSNNEVKKRLAEERVLDAYPDYDNGTGRFVVPDSTEGWARAVQVATWLAWIGVSVPDFFDYSQIRPKGAPLLRKGGFASGPQPLIDLIEAIFRVCSQAGGRRLRSDEAHYLYTMVGASVVVGGVRRMAAITTSDIRDQRMLVYKDWKHPGGGLRVQPEACHVSNNSAAVTSRTTEYELRNELRHTFEAENGERGLWFEEGLTQGHLRPNACVTGDTLVATQSGMIAIEDLAATDTSCLVALDRRLSHNLYGLGIHAVLKRTDADLVRVVTKEGYSIKCTPDHRILTSAGDRAASHLAVGDKVFVGSHDPGSVVFVNDENNKHALIAGFVAADGCYVKAKNMYRAYFYEKKIGACSEIREALETYGSCQFYSQPGNDRMYYDFDVKENLFLAGSTNKEDAVRFALYRPLNEQAAFLRGLFAGDGSVNKPDAGKGVNVRLSSVSREMLTQVQTMLVSFGVFSRIFKRRDACVRQLPSNDGTGGTSAFACQVQWELIISKQSVTAFNKYIGIAHTEKQQRLSDSFVGRKRGAYKETYLATVQAVEILDEKANVYDLTQPDTAHFTANGIVIHNCGEITNDWLPADNTAFYDRGFLPDYDDGGAGGMCNLTAAVLRFDDTPATAETKVIAATLFGTVQAKLTDFGILPPGWKKLADRDAQLGVDITGQTDATHLTSDAALMKRLRETAETANDIFADALGIRRAVRVTTVKPGGNSAALARCSSGASARHSRYSIQRMEIAADHPLAQTLRASAPEIVVAKPGTASHGWVENDDGHKIFYGSLPEISAKYGALGNGIRIPAEERVEGSLYLVENEETAHTILVEFPLETPPGALSREEDTAQAQLARYRRLRAGWVSGPRRQAISITVTYRPEEVPSLTEDIISGWRKEGECQWAGLSFLPYSPDVYFRAPREEITSEKVFRARQSVFLGAWQRIDWGLYRELDSGAVDGKATGECSGKGCELRFS